MKNSMANIRTVLKSYRRDLDKTTQRSELLKRNEPFCKEFQGFKNRVGETFFKVKGLDDEELLKVHKYNILYKLDYPVVDYSASLRAKNIKTDRYWKSSINLDVAPDEKPKNLREKISNKHYVLRNYVRQWAEFCGRWHIETEWDGVINHLEQYVRPNVEIYSDWEYDIQQAFIYIRITEWATLEDIRSKWDIIENLQNEMWGKKESRANFGRDLIWYDLSKEFRLKASEIAELWNKHYPQDIDLLVIKRYRKQIEKNDIGGNVYDDRTLLNEVRSGRLANEHKKYFEEERHYYATGKIKKGSKYISSASPFVDVIKKAITRMKRQIAASSMPPIPSNRVHMGPPPQRIS